LSEGGFTHVEKRKRSERQEKTVEFKLILFQRDIDRWKIGNAASRIEI